MEQSNNSLSVYGCITKLCEKTVNSRQSKSSCNAVKKLRSKAYELLLSKRILKIHDPVQLENVSDPFNHLLAWQFVLINDYGLTDHADKLQNCVSLLQRSSTYSDTLLQNILIFLTKVKQNPDIITCRKGLPTAFSNHDDFKKSYFRQFNDTDFKLPFPTICTGSKFNDESFQLKKSKTKSSHHFNFALNKDSCKTCAMFPDKITCRNSRTTLRSDIKSVCVVQEEDVIDVWDVMYNTKLTDHCTWETLGNPCPETEPCFLTEALPEISNIMYNMTSLQINLLHKQFLITRKVISQKDFIKNIKYLLVGIPTDCFKYNVNGNFELTFGTAIEDLSSTAVASYCKDFIFCATCYKALHEMCTSTDNHGFIFKELCESIKRYLSYYRIASNLISEKSNLLEIHKHMKKLISHLDILASVCKVGPFAESAQLPNGVALLNYLYQKVMSLSNKDIIMVLCSVLYPCIQVYFGRFLQQWIFEGVINDAFNEFFVLPNQKYLNTRGRTYWTRSYKIQEDVVPDFLTELRSDIFACGKAMNLLKLCAPNSTMCVYLMGKKPSLLTCCLTSDQLKKLEQNASCYYLEVIAESGKFSIANVISRSEEEQIIFLNQVTKIRAATLKRLALEKLKKAKEESQRKREQIAELKAQYDFVMQQKKMQNMENLEREMKMNEVNLRMENLREKIIQEEANELVKYYENLSKILEQKRAQIENNTAKLKNIPLEVQCSLEHINETEILDVNKSDDTISSSETYVSTSSDITKPSEEMIVDADETPIQIPNSEILDIINANSDEKLQKFDIANLAAENFEMARRNKAKVMSVEMGLTINNDLVQKSKNIPYSELSALQKNRIKMMHTEFGIDVCVNVPVKKDLTIAEINKRKNMAHTEFSDDIRNDNFKNSVQNINETASTLLITNCDNENYINSNVDEEENHEVEVNDNSTVENYNVMPSSKAKADLKLDFTKIKSPSIFSKFFKSPNFEFNKPVPMSIDSTPCTDTFSTLKIDSQATTAATNFTDEGFSFTDVETERKPILCSGIQDRKLVETSITSKRVEMKDALLVSTTCLKRLIQHSVSIVLRTQTELLNNELLKYFIKDLQYLLHLKSLRNYFFLLDGEFARNITEGLFEKLYDANFPVDLINARTLCHLVYRAIDSSIKLQETSNCLSFKINKLPKKFDLGDPDVLDCLSLTYKITWPLNILLPSDTIGKYDEVFKFLLKLYRISWILKQMFQELKIFGKKIGKREAFLMLSPQFQKLHQCRHTMTQFIQCLQSYIIGDVLETSWSTFEKKLVYVTNLDELYSLHTTYIKDILFMCLLNQKSSPMRKIIQKIFIIIFKFYNYLRAKEWQFEEDEGVYIHPNFKKLEDIFLNFEEFVVHLCKTSQKVADVGCQPQIILLLDKLNVNSYYIRKYTT